MITRAKIVITCMVGALSIILVAFAVRAAEPASCSSSDKLELKTFEKIYQSGYDAGYNQGVIDMINEMSKQGTDQEAVEEDSEESEDQEITEDDWIEMYPERQSERMPTSL